MANVAGSYVDVVGDWEKLLAAVLEQVLNTPDIERHQSALEGHLVKTKAVKARQEAHTAGRQAATQELRKMLAEGRELAIRLRGAIKAEVGPKSERLVQFGMTPIRSRRRKKAQPPEATPPATTEPPKSTT